MRNKTFVIGCGRLGASIALDAYARGDNVTVIDAEDSSFERLSEAFAGYTEVADATDIKTLAELGMDSALSAIITTGNDNVNLFLAHVMDKVFKVPHIYVRFDDPTLAPLIEGYNVQAIYPFQLSFETFTDMKKEDEE
ncbi:MAG: TrkA family potassium uptake protein [Bacilli bacterium]|nr:TrkA family potassium uptake protein [Bacilli bacterium]